MNAHSEVVDWDSLDDLEELVDIFDPVDPPEWQDRALCAQTDPEAFYPEKGGSTREAKRICQGCEVKAECLEYALAHDERWGIWGGLSEMERRKLRKSKKLTLSGPEPRIENPARIRRDAEILRLETSGGSDSWIAEQVGASTKTVHRARIRNTNQAA